MRCIVVFRGSLSIGRLVFSREVKRLGVVGTRVIFRFSTCCVLDGCMVVGGFLFGSFLVGGCGIDYFGGFG